MNWRLAASTAFIAAVACLATIQPWDRQTRVFPTAAESRLTGFSTGSWPSVAAYDDLFGYFVEGFDTFRYPSGASAGYPGLGSKNGAAADALEGFSRLAPLFGAWVYSGRTPHIALTSGQVVDIRDTFLRGLIAGTDPDADDYWGDIHDLNQRIVEAADVALALWLFRNDVWARLTQSQQDDVVRWLGQVEGKKVPDNNWHGFPVLVSAVLVSLGREVDRDIAWQHYQRLKQFYRGSGWFSDGPEEVFDYYNAWSIHYNLQWLHLVDPAWDSEFIVKVVDEFLATYRYLIGPRGFPVLGRSTCYRMAAPAPLILAQATANRIVPPGEAKRGLDAIWTYFVERGAIQSGTVVQGYCGPDPRVLDNYSGPASCHWALRSLVAAFVLPRDSRFWSDPPSPLPVEQASYQVRIPTIGWTVIGDISGGTIRIVKPGIAPNPLLSEYSFLRRLASTVLWRPFRPDNHRAKYEGAEYRSDKPFCGCLM
jgi:hypothetical protein